MTGTRSSCVWTDFCFPGLSAGSGARQSVHRGCGCGCPCAGVQQPPRRAPRENLTPRTGDWSRQSTTSPGSEPPHCTFPRPRTGQVTDGRGRTGTVRVLVPRVLSCSSTSQGPLPSNSCPFLHLSSPACSLHLSSDATHYLLLEAFADSSRLVFEAPGIYPGFLHRYFIPNIVKTRTPRFSPTWLLTHLPHPYKHLLQLWILFGSDPRSHLSAPLSKCIHYPTFSYSFRCCYTRNLPSPLAWMFAIDSSVLSLFLFLFAPLPVCSKQRISAQLSKGSPLVPG